MTTSNQSSRGSWDRHWASLQPRKSGSLFGVMSSVVRKTIFQPAVQYFLEKYFCFDGVFIEVGCGTGESSAAVPRRNRKFIGIDFSMLALNEAGATACFDSLLCADMFRLPLASASVDGIWNLGVMEHFEREALSKALAEFRRVLKPNGTIVLFWPAEGNASRWLLGPIEWFVSAVVRQQFRFFPDEVSRLKSRGEAVEILSEAGLSVVEVDFSSRTAFIHRVIVAVSAVDSPL